MGGCHSITEGQISQQDYLYCEEFRAEMLYQFVLENIYFTDFQVEYPEILGATKKTSILSGVEPGASERELNSAKVTAC